MGQQHESDARRVDAVASCRLDHRRHAGPRPGIDDDVAIGGLHQVDLRIERVGRRPVRFTAADEQDAVGQAHRASVRPRQAVARGDGTSRVVRIDGIEPRSGPAPSPPASAGCARASRATMAAANDPRHPPRLQRLKRDRGVVEQRSPDRRDYAEREHRENVYGSRGAAPIPRTAAIAALSVRGTGTAPCFTVRSQATSVGRIVAAILVSWGAGPGRAADCPRHGEENSPLDWLTGS